MKDYFKNANQFIKEFRNVPHDMEQFEREQYQNAILNKYRYIVVDILDNLSNDLKDDDIYYSKYNFMCAINQLFHWSSVLERLTRLYRGEYDFQEEIEKNKGDKENETN